MSLVGVNSREAVIGALRQTFRRYRGEFVDATAPADVPGWDSFRHVQLMFEIERRIGRQIDITQTYRLQSVGELIGFLDRNL